MKVSDIEYKRVNFEETAEAVKSCKYEDYIYK